MTDGELLVVFTHAVLTTGAPPEEAADRGYIAAMKVKDYLQELEDADDGSD